MSDSSSNRIGLIYSSNRRKGINLEEEDVLLVPEGEDGFGISSKLQVMFTTKV